MPRCRFAEVEHTADWALEVEADSMAELLRCAAQGMYYLLRLTSEQQTGGQRQLDLSSDDREGLLVSWLEELLFLLEVEGVAASEMAFQSTSDVQLQADLTLVQAQSSGKQIKGVTYHNLTVERTDSGLRTIIVFDV